VEVLVVGELAVRSAGRAVSLERRDLDEAGLLPREIAVIRAVQQERDVERRGEVERLADVVGNFAVGAERDRGVAARVVATDEMPIFPPAADAVPTTTKSASRTTAILRTGDPPVR
jgi:hypothetical protein